MIIFINIILDVILFFLRKNNQISLFLNLGSDPQLVI